MKKSKSFTGNLLTVYPIGGILLFVSNYRMESAMLVLSRKLNESIVINNDIVITVVEVRGDKVRLGIVAPKDVPVHREEIYKAIQSQGSKQPA